MLPIFSHWSEAFRPELNVCPCLEVMIQGSGGVGGRWPDPGRPKIFFPGAHRPIASFVVVALTLFYCRARSPQNVCSGALTGSPKY